MPRSLAQIAARSIDASGRAAALGDLFRIYAYAQREEGSFHWITIPRDVNMVGEEVFDPVQMQKLYDLGLRMAGGARTLVHAPAGAAAALSRPAPLRPTSPTPGCRSPR